MNLQKPGIEWCHPYGRPGYTWNVVSGCFHKCRWTMPDGVTAVCYAETVAERVAQKSYPHGFAHHYWNEGRLNEPLALKEPAGIFLDSMSDLMGAWVEKEQIEKVLDVCSRASQHIFFLLTKNPARLLQFSFPSNVWVGVSMPPDSFMGKPINDHQKRRFMQKTLEVLAFMQAGVKWISFEPLSWDVSEFLVSASPIQWAVIGAASNGRNYYQPDSGHVHSLLSVLDSWNVPVFFKGNLRTNPAASPWREEYPKPLVK